MEQPPFIFFIMALKNIIINAISNIESDDIQHAFLPSNELD